MIRRAPSLFLLLGVLAIMGLAWSFVAAPANAAPLPQEGTPSPAPAQPGASPSPTRMPNLEINDQYCLDCHGQPIEPFVLENGDQLDMFVDAAWHQNSIHGELGYTCVQCHTEVGEYPHPVWQAADRRDATLKLTVACKSCHEQQFALAEDDVHASAQKGGIREAAVCVDCHTAHEVRQLTDPDSGELLPETRQWIPDRCALCHNAIYEKYETSVHGSALNEGNVDVPTCIDCHGVHNIASPTTDYFRLRSPQICADCHTDEAKMGKYGLNTDVLNTYVADFHGTTVAIFEKVSPDAPVNKAVCYDCHGIHDIAASDDPQKGLLVKQNLLARCQDCHPDATEDFPSAWLSHYSPSPDKYPLVYYVNLFYKIFIPGILGGMGVMVVLDFSRAYYNRRKRAAGHTPAAPVPAMHAPADTTAVDMQPAESAETPPAAPDGTVALDAPATPDETVMPDEMAAPDASEPFEDDAPLSAPDDGDDDSTPTHPEA